MKYLSPAIVAILLSACSPRTIAIRAVGDTSSLCTIQQVGEDATLSTVQISKDRAEIGASTVDDIQLNRSIKLNKGNVVVITQTGPDVGVFGLVASGKKKISDGK